MTTNRKKTLAPHHFKPTHKADFQFGRWFCQLTEQDEITHPSELFEPSRFVHHAAALRPNDIVRFRAADGSFDFETVVIASVGGGVMLELWPRLPAGFTTPTPAPVLATANDGKPCPRVEEISGQFIVFDLDGLEHSRHRQEAQAFECLADYRAALGLTSPEEAAKAQAVREAKRAIPKAAKGKAA